jgi:N-acetylglucosaminyldiphosphoundecaprenol N-acetyl-beta-D-mannosaminyltransferase
MSPTNPTLGPRRGLYIGRIWVDAVTFAGALERIDRLVEGKLGGAVYTPNVDHVVIAESSEALRNAYRHASLSLADGAPLVWVSRLLGCRIPERVAGSDLFMPLMIHAARRQWRVYLLGGAPEVAEAAAKRLKTEFGVNVVGWHSPIVDRDGRDLSGGSVERVRAAQPDLVVVALGNPKQELWTHRAGDALRPAVVLGFGAVLDFLVGKQKRAPQWVARGGFEWLYRLVQEPRRLWKRYLVQDPRFVLIVLATWYAARRDSLRQAAPGGM